MRHTYPLIIALLLAVTAACSRRPSMVLSEEDMAQLMADVHEAEGVIDQNYNAYREDSAKLRLRQAVYVKHGVTQAEVDSSLAWYGYNIEKYAKVYDRVLEILDKRLKNVRSQAGEASKPEMNFAVEGDSAVVWRTYNPIFFTPRMEREMVSTMLQRDQYWRAADSYQLRYKSLGATKGVMARITLNYSGDSTATQVMRGSMDGWHTMVVNTDTAAIPQSVVLELRYSPAPGTETIAAIDSVTLVRVRTRSDDLPDHR